MIQVGDLVQFKDYSKGVVLYLVKCGSAFICCERWMCLVVEGHDLRAVAYNPPYDDEGKDITVLTPRGLVQVRSRFVEVVLRAPESGAASGMRSGCRS